MRNVCVSEFWVCLGQWGRIVQTVKRNQEDLGELCGNVMELLTLLRYRTWSSSLYPTTIFHLGWIWPSFGSLDMAADTSALQLSTSPFGSICWFDLTFWLIGCPLTFVFFLDSDQLSFWTLGYITVDTFSSTNLCLCEAKIWGSVHQLHMEVSPIKKE
jgi:hypothetical protein